MGKPAEFDFTLSKYSELPAGKFVFKVTNRGRIGHSFKVCAKPVSYAILYSCDAGVSTRVLRKGESQTIVVTLKKGTYEFLDTRVAHAKDGGMTGLLGVGVVVPEQPGGCLFPRCVA